MSKKPAGKPKTFLHQRNNNVIHNDGCYDVYVSLMEEEFLTSENVVSSDRILYTPSDFARGCLLHLQEIGTLQALKPHVSSRSDLSSFLFFTVLSGSGSLVYNGRNYPLAQGCCVFIDCLSPYSHMTSDNDLWSLRWCHFQGPSLSSVYQKYTARGGRPVFSPPDCAPFIRILDDLFELAGSDDHIRDMRINEKLSGLLTLLMEESWHPEEAAPKGSKKASASAVKEYLELHYAEKISLDSLSREFFINKFYLTRVFREQYGMSISACLLNIRITRAKQLLRFSDKTVSEIGLQCGLGQLHYFSRVFKQVEGISPVTYRNQW